MPKLITRPPKYARHKASGQAVVKINGKVRYLGPWNSVESKVRYQEAISAWAAEQDSRPSATVSINLPESDAVISELLAAYMRRAQTYYLKNGVPTSMTHLIRSIVRLWKDSFASVLVRDIRPSHLKALQKRMVTEGQTGGYVNKVTSYSKSMFRWAVENDLAPPEVWQALLAVRGLAKGRTEAREPEPIGPVEDSVVDACLPYVPTVVTGMVQRQRFTGMRPREACSIRAGRSGGTAMVITLGPELETALNDLAVKRGVPPESLAWDVLRDRFLVDSIQLQPCDDWERGPLEAAQDCGVSLPDWALSSDGLYD